VDAAESPALHARLRQIGELLRRGDGSGAIARCEAALIESPDNSDALRFLALGHLQVGNLVEADRSLLRAMRFSPADPELMNALGILRLKQEAYAEAVQSFTRCLDIAPTHRDALSNLASAYTAMRQPHLASDYLERLTGVLPFSAPAYVRASDNRLAVGEVEKAVNYGRRAVRLDPENSSGRLSLAEALEVCGRFKQAKYQYIAVLAANPGNARALAGLLSLQGTQVGDRYVSSAHRLLGAAELPDRDRVQLHLALARHYDRRGQYARAFEHLQIGNATRFKNHPFDSIANSRAVDRLIGCWSGAGSFPASSVRGKRPIFIVGMPRSGTTLVEQILAAHSQVAAGGELPTILNIAAQIGGTSNAYPEAMRELDQDSLSRLAGQYLGKLEKVAGGAARVTDKMPFNFMHLGLIAALFPDAAIIHCRRSAADTCLSCYFTSFNEELQFASDLNALGRYWMDYWRMMQHWHRVLPPKILDVHYERLVSDTEATVREMLEFCELAWEPSCMRFFNVDRGVRTPSRWQVRQPIYPQSVGRWRHYERQLRPLLDILPRESERSAPPLDPRTG
jgi:tetratricopeptide (TPR) repeat protein